MYLFELPNVFFVLKTLIFLWSPSYGHQDGREHTLFNIFAKCIFQNCKIYLSKLPILFVQIAKFICQHLKCIYPNCKMYLPKLQNIFFVLLVSEIPIFLPSPLSAHNFFTIFLTLFTISSMLKGNSYFLNTF